MAPSDPDATGSDRMTTGTVFIMTIDTEGDNLWARPDRVTTENARHLPRFQSLCEASGFKPTYLVNYEMAMEPAFQAFGGAAVRRRTAEIGLHVHPWYSPPIDGAYQANSPHIYLYDLPDEMLRAKVESLTRLLSDVFEVRPVSHRAGKWGFDERVARVLADLGYLVDCSVTPGISWRRYQGMPGGKGGPDFSDFPTKPYFLDLNNIKSAGQSLLLEVPVTIKPHYHEAAHRLYRLVARGIAGKAIRQLLGPPYVWLRPNGRNINTMLKIVEWGVQQRLPVLEFMLHSSEFMPEGSPTFKTAEQIEVLYEHLKRLFARLASLGVVGMTLGEYRSTLPARPLSPYDSSPW